MLGLLSDPMMLILSAFTTLIALTGHEFAHGWVSSKLGDPTARMQGRLTLNPLAHLDPVGTVLMLLTGFGWARPVPINPRYYKNIKRGTALTAIAGPLANLIMALISTIIYTAIFICSVKLDASANFLTNLTTVWMFFLLRNLCFMVFNLIPIPPLDGSKVLAMFLPNPAYYKMMQLERYSMIIIILLSFLGVFDLIIGNGVNFIAEPLVNWVLHTIYSVLS